MSDAMKVVPAPEPVKTGVRDTKRLAKGLTEALADTYRMVFKTHAFPEKAAWKLRATAK